MRIAIYHNLPTGGALRATHKQLQLLGEPYTLDSFSLSSAGDAANVIDSLCQVSRSYQYQLSAPHWKYKLQHIAWLLDLRRMERVHQRIAADVDAGGYDLCITLTCPYFELPFIPIYARTPVLYMCHSTTYPALVTLREGATKRRARKSNPVARRYERILAERKHEAAQCAALIAANSFFSREELFRTYQVNARVLYPAVDTAAFFPEHTIDKESAVMGVGALAPFKAHELSIRAIGTLPSDIRPEMWIAYHTEVAGEKDYLINLAMTHNVQLKLFNNVSTHELRRLYNRASATLFPSICEPLGLVPLESMACGTPVVGVAEGGTRETVVNGMTGILTNRDVDEFAQAVRTVLEDRTRAASFGEAGVGLIHEKWTWDKSMAQFRALIEMAAR